jgi:hypothetical protein
MCGGDIETILRENAVFFVRGSLEQIAQSPLPDLAGEVLLCIIKVPS